MKGKTGDICKQPGVYVFAGYADGAKANPPGAGETTVKLNKGDAFPMIKSVKKSAFWNLQG